MLNQRQPDPPDTEARSGAVVTGARILQGLVLGFALLVAVSELVSSELGATIFRYQGF